MMKNWKQFKRTSETNWHILGVPAAVLIMILAVGLFAPDLFAAVIDAGFSWIACHLGIVFMGGSFGLIVFCIWTAAGPWGKIRLGGESAKAEMPLPVWMSMTFTSGMGLGVIFYAVAEPMTHYMNPPGFSGLEGGTAEAAAHALSYVFFHWGLHPYAIYTAAGLGFAYICWNCGRDFRLSAGLYPLLGEKGESGLTGRVVHWICMVVVVASLGTTLGFCGLQIAGGIKYVFHTDVPDLMVQVPVILLLTVVGCFTAAKGVTRAMKTVSLVNMGLSFLILAAAFVFSDKVFILSNTISSAGRYLGQFFGESFLTDSANPDGWVNQWTIFYLAWWISVAPLTGLFQIQMAKGRTIRQFVMVNLLVPIGFIVVWFGTMGSAAISAAMKGHPEIWNMMQEMGLQVSLFAWIDTLPKSFWLFLVVFLVSFLSYIGQYQSMTFTLAEMTVKEEAKPKYGTLQSPVWMKIFWGTVISLMGFVLLRSGGLKAVQRSVVIFGIPVLVLIWVNLAGFVRAVLNRDL